MTVTQSKANAPEGVTGRSLAPSRPRTWSKVLNGALPYLAIAPAFFTFVVLLGIPVVLLFWTSFQRYGLGEFINHTSGPFVGLQNYVDVIFNSPQGLPDFATVLFRTTAFMVGCVTMTVVLGMLVALLLMRLNRYVRLLLTASMVLAWATPAVTGAVVFQWLFDPKFGVVNWTISQFGIFGDYLNHEWFTNGVTVFVVAGILIVWQAIPFVALSLYAGLLTIPGELTEAARVDGASERQIFRHIYLPALVPLLMMLIFLSVIWDFKVYTQLYAIALGGPDNQSITLSIYSFIMGIAEGKYGYAAAASVVMMLLLMIVLIPYLRRMIKSQEAM
jgi:N,N'-diacetylchitobiose transport system permease protein